LLLIDRDHGRIAPQAFELIKLAERWVKNVHDHVYVIEQDPAALLNAFHVMSARTLFA
jgi:hypothetical protein